MDQSVSPFFTTCVGASSRADSGTGDEPPAEQLAAQLAFRL